MKLIGPQTCLFEKESIAVFLHSRMMRSFSAAKEVMLWQPLGLGVLLVAVPGTEGLSEVLGTQAHTLITTRVGVDRLL